MNSRNRRLLAFICSLALPASAMADDAALDLPLPAASTTASTSVASKSAADESQADDTDSAANAHGPWQRTARAEDAPVLQKGW